MLVDQSDTFYPYPSNDSSQRDLLSSIKRKPVSRETPLKGTGSKEGSTAETISLTSRKSAPKRSGTIFAPGPHTWTLEISAIVLSIAALVAVAVLLPLYDNKPLTKWNFFLSFNTVISILGATSRAALAFAIGSCISQGKWNWFSRRYDSIMVFDRFEEASRGPWGSVRLLWWSKMRHWVALGALCTVILLGFEPFLQAVITFYGKEVVVPRGATSFAGIGQTKRLDIGRMARRGSEPQRYVKIPEPWDNITTQVMDLQYDFGPLAAIWAGFSNQSLVDKQNTAYSCSSGNCTWDDYASLAVCNTCNDISSHIEITKGRAPILTNLTTMPYTSTTQVINPNDTFAFTKHEIKELNMNISNFDDLDTKSLSRLENALLTAKATSQPGNTVSFKDVRTLISSFAMLSASWDYRNTGEGWAEAKVEATECALHFCVNVYNSEVTRGVLSERVVQSYAERNLDSYVSLNVKDMERTRVYNRYYNYTLDFGNVDLDRSDLQLLVPKDSEFGRTKSNMEDLQFNVSHGAAASITSLFMDRFAKRVFPRTNEQLIYPVSQFSDNDPVPPMVIISLGTSRDLGATFDTVAASMTKWMRDRSGQEEPLVGETREWVVHIRVRWAFVSLPIGALLGGCVFCLLSMFETRRLGLPAWKGSSLAGLAHGLDSESRERLRAADNLSQMDEHAKGAKVRFVNSSLGPELSSKGIRT
ncbi:hypothetical protein CPLU01_06232 [Colletotrichum plurivorum]|uniref:DUF3176 domain containing protein n=1 Tax=Colletotrichum plurivorum TaxID=2175906 RepID=A0A8H6KJT5_9PEZI|nr:hypothetical protein CPLU01_06232 [Colletotrichum plurivorum]